ncbi:hypothetical protein SCHIN_v1c00960 [Spiroplasma chinense]|uniref:Pr6Pr family membrane protein n=1 Tax=Spiroplasma chinense TaxID=216932 RepID=A0A5B9Y2J8_9MOLU|nr:hypothetical protein [Spiroplasma chinense]QEH61294.1 hypothetical protein SCHIN_v1c00960 [Spiroplasma chinense]
MKKRFFKNPVWYCYLVLTLNLMFFMMWGIYMAGFVEGWYNMGSWFLNYDTLMSFFSVQVNIMTIVWLIFVVLCFDKEPRGLTSEGFKKTMMNWNLIVFIIFWAGIIFELKDSNTKLLDEYTISQIVCTVMTHFICTLALFFIFIFTTGHKKESYITWYKEKDIYFSLLYPFLYLFYVYIRGLIYLKDGEHIWPYPFMEFEKDSLWLGTSVGGYMTLVVVVFVIWIVTQHILLIAVNNLVFYIRGKTKVWIAKYKKKSPKEELVSQKSNSKTT